MFYLPTPDHRTELMIIYGEVLQEDSKVPLNTLRDVGVLLDDAAPEAAKDIRDRAIRGMGIKNL